ncbi:hypothetical protein [Natronococcus occultus]|uniref:CARDB domain-containing protein n=1 Tax=Natronococcus occultus SP4 TaxID=694430 RepID=L0K1J6_9EURY|nr:hypothetical protein [Natronococcus occultus]AGB38415.1 hypothetical protein Natoc_2653 [Natronococcus occultus SP4]
MAGLFGSLSTAADEHGEEAETQDVEVEYEYRLEGEGDDEQLEERLELSSGEYHYSGDEDEPQNCYVTFSAENVSDDEIRVDFWATVDDHSTWDTQSLLDPGESGGARLESLNPDNCPTDPDQVTITARSPYIGDPHEPPEDDEGEDGDVEFEYTYTVEQGDDEQLEERLELSSGEFDSCTVEADVENLSDDEGISFYRYAVVDGNPTHESQTSLDPGESDSISMEINQGVADECPDDPDQATVHTWVASIGESDEPPEDDEEPEDEEEADDDEPKDKDDLDLSVSAPDSIPYEETADPSEDAADFCITVTNRGDETVSVDGQFEIGPIDEPLPLDLEPGETETTYYGVMSRDLGPGDHEWTVTANGETETETGTLTVTDDEEC